MKLRGTIFSTASGSGRMHTGCPGTRIHDLYSLQMFLLYLTSMLLMGCSDRHVSSDAGSVVEASGPPRVVVTSYALQFMVSEMVSDAATVVLLPAKRGVSQLPSADEIQQLQTADLILLSGAGNEPWLQTISLPKSRVTDTSASYRQQLLTAADTVTHQHGPRGADANDNLISRTWLSPELAIAQARQAERRLISLLPEHADQITARAQALVTQLQSIQEAVQQLAETTDDVTVFATTSDFGYLVQSLGWKLQLISEDASELPPENSANGLRLVFVPQQAPTEPEKKMHSAETRLARLDRLEQPTNDKTFMNRMKANIDAIRAALEAAK